MEVAQETKIEIEEGGEKLAHYFKSLKSGEWLDYQRQIGALDGAEAEKSLKIALANYDARIVRVEGYCHEGDELMAKRPEDWREWIPGGHKYLAWIELVTGAQLKKKSATRSES